MKTIDSLDNLNIPNKHKRYITHYLSNLKRNKLFHHISKVILFGSCAREEVKDFSDIDIFLMTHIELKEDDELSLLFDPIPYKVDGIYIPMDTLLQSQEKYNLCKEKPYMVQKFIEKDGIILNVKGVLLWVMMIIL